MVYALICQNVNTSIQSVKFWKTMSQSKEKYIRLTFAIKFFLLENIFHKTKELRHRTTGPISTNIGTKDS